MKTVTKMGAQGDVMFIKTKPSDMPKNLIEDPKHICALSETHHHHIVETPDAKYFPVPNDPLTAYVQLGPSGQADIVHHRPWDTHEMLRLLGEEGDVFTIKRQREYTPEGWRRVAD